MSEVGLSFRGGGSGDVEVGADIKLVELVLVWTSKICHQVKQLRKLSLQSRMCTEGGRRILLRKILRGKDVLAH